MLMTKEIFNYLCQRQIEFSAQSQVKYQDNTRNLIFIFTFKIFFSYSAIIIIILSCYNIRTLDLRYTF